MKIQMTTKLSCLAMGLLLLAACTTTKVLNEWRNTDCADKQFGHLMVVALFKQDQTRRMFEDEFAWQISNLGTMVTRSYNLVPSLNGNTTARIATIAKAVGADGVLVIRMVNSKQQTITATDNSALVPMNLSEFLQYSGKDNSDPPSLVTNTVITVESRLFDAQNGKLVWSLTTQSKNQFGLKWEINSLAKRVLDKIKAATRTK